MIFFFGKLNIGSHISVFLFGLCTWQGMLAIHNPHLGKIGTATFFGPNSIQFSISIFARGCISLFFKFILDLPRNLHLCFQCLLPSSVANSHVIPRKHLRTRPSRRHASAIAMNQRPPGLDKMRHLAGSNMKTHPGSARMDHPGFGPFGGKNLKKHGFVWGVLFQVPINQSTCLSGGGFF